MKIKKYNICIVMTLFLVLFMTPVAGAESNIIVTHNGKTLTFDVNPLSVEGRTLVPLRGIFEELGMQVNFDSATKTITGTGKESTIILVQDSKTATVNGRDVTLDVAATAINGRIMVPLRFISESTGADVSWDGNTKTVAIYTNELVSYQEYADSLMESEGNFSYNNAYIQYYRVVLVEFEEDPGILYVIFDFEAAENEDASYIDLFDKYPGIVKEHYSKIAEEVSDYYDKNVLLRLIYDDYFDEYQSIYAENDLQNNTITYDDNKNQYFVYFPYLDINVYTSDADGEYYYQWSSTEFD